jgi:hypothetical protein
MDRYMGYVKIDDDYRKKLIIKYVAGQQGCTREEIDRHKDEVPISRQKLYDLIKELIDEGPLKESLERINSRDHKLYPVHDSIFFTAPREFEQVSEAYKRLLQLFENKINSSRSLPANRRTYSENVSIIEPLIGEISRELDLFMGLEQNHKGQTRHQKAADLLKMLQFYINKSLARYNKLKSDRSIDFHLLQSIAIDTFYFVNDCYFHRSLLRWSTKIIDKDGRFRLNNLLYSIISEMHLQLTEFLNMLKTVNGVSIANMFKHKSFLDPISLENDLGHYIIKYGPESEIERILEVLTMTCTELKDYDYPYFSRGRCESIIDADKKILRIQKEVSRIKKDFIHKNNIHDLNNELVSLRNMCNLMVEI